MDIKLKKYIKANEKFGITINYLLNLTSRDYELFESSKIKQKRQLINFLLSNLRLKRKTLLYQVNKPFDAILNGKKFSNWLAIANEVRTRIIGLYNKDIFIPVLTV